MKRFICAMLLSLATLTISAMSQTNAIGSPDQDIGYEQVATLSVDGQTVASFDSQFNIVGWQTPVVLNTEVSKVSAQVVDAYSVQTQAGEISMTLVNYKWPNLKNECTVANRRINYIHNAYCVPYSRSYSFYDCAHGII